MSKTDIGHKCVALSLSSYLDIDVCDRKKAELFKPYSFLVPLERRQYVLFRETVRIKSLSFLET